MTSKKKQMSLIIIAAGFVLVLVLIPFRSHGEQTQGEKHQDINQSVLRVETIKPKREDVSRQLTLSGGMEAFEQTTLYSKVAGYLEWIKVDIGDWTKKGDVIAKIEVPEMLDEYEAVRAELNVTRAGLGLAQAELERAKAGYELKEISYQRLERIHKEEPDMIPQQRVDEAKAEFQVSSANQKVIESKIHQIEAQIQQGQANLGRLKTLMAYSEIKAPFSGIVTERFVHPGAFIQLASTSPNARSIATVARMDIVRVFVDVPESEVSFVERGDPSVMVVDALKGHKFEGKVTRFATALDPSTRTMRTEIDIPNRKNLLRPGMYGHVTLTLEKNLGAITLPSSALRVESDRMFVYCIIDGLARIIEVETGGFDDGIKVEITKGLVGTETVILAARGTLSEGMRVEAVKSSGD